MCGRFSNRHVTADDIVGRLHAKLRAQVAEQALGRANLAPTQQMLTIVRGKDGEREAISARFGLVPSWSKLKGGRLFINARDDALATSRVWKPLVSDASHRALIVTDGYYEWLKAEDATQPSQPFFHRLPGGQPFCFAGLWTTATPKDAEKPVTSALIVATRANREAARVHDRMPAILDGPDAEAAWLSPDVDLDGALDLVHPLPDGRLEVFPVSTLVNNVRNEGDELTEPLGQAT